VRSDAAHAASRCGRTCQRVLERKLWKNEEAAIVVEISSLSKYQEGSVSGADVLVGTRVTSSVFLYISGSVVSLAH
jgi:hypothetical protein